MTNSVLPDISIIVVNYNTYQLTTNCIRSILDKTTEIDFEIILVDNASNECEPDNFKKKFPQINLIKSNQNLGFAAGNNLGIQQAKGKYILLLNSDTELVNNAIKIAVELMERDRSIGVLSGQLQYPDGELQAVAGKFPSISRELRELLRINKFLSATRRPNYFLGSQWDYNNAVEADWVWGAFFMFRKSDLQYFPNGKLHDNFFMYGEDIQWCYHFKKNIGKKILYHPGPKVVHYIGGSEKEKESGFSRYAKKMLPNEYTWLKMEHGWLYAKTYYLLKALLHFSLRTFEDRQKTNVFFSVVFQGPN